MDIIIQASCVIPWEGRLGADKLDVNRMMRERRQRSRPPHPAIQSTEDKDSVRA